MNPALDKTQYVQQSVRGAGGVGGMSRAPDSPREQTFRQQMEARKDALLAARERVRHPVLVTNRQRETAQRNIRTTWWGGAWFERIRSGCETVASMSDEDMERLIPDLTPGNPLGFTCPNCVGKRSQEGMGVSMFAWTPRRPDTIACKVCGQVLPDARYPETGMLACPRRGQTFHYYLNDAERAHPDDRSGRYAWHWVRRPMHVSFSGIARVAAVGYMITAARNLGTIYQITGNPRYASAAARILQRLTVTVPSYLYHDYWDTVADCDPLYAAWHDTALPLEWKRHPCESAFEKDTLERASMLQSYWGAGRIRAYDIYYLDDFASAYDLTVDARSADGVPVWSEAWRTRVERDLLLEYAFSVEPCLGGPGKAEDLSNKSPRAYLAFAVMGLTLGMPEYVHGALLGYEGLRDRKFLFDGFSHESPAYTNMYLSQAIWIPERVEGYRWPASFRQRRGTVHLFRDDPKLGLILRAQHDSLRGNGKYCPLSDTLVVGAPTPYIHEIGVKRYPEYFNGILPTVYRAQTNVMGDGTPDVPAPPDVTGAARDLRPSEYAVFNLDETDLMRDAPRLPEILFPAWRTAILRHGVGNRSAEATLAFNPRGGHRHADQLAVFYADGGHVILGEQGYVGDSAMLSWGGSTESHNLVWVDDHGQIDPSNRCENDGPDLRLMMTTPLASVVEADARAYPQCSRYRRLIALIKGPGERTLLLDVFRVTGGSQHTYRMFSELAASDARDGKRLFDGLPMPPEAPLPDFGGSIAREHVFGLRDARGVDGPPASWRATWRQADRAYRLHCLSDADRVETAHGPGQEALTQAGRRVRYLDILTRGTDPLSSTFVMLHEPSASDGGFAVRSAQRLALPVSAGPDALAVRLETEWGVYLAFNRVDQETEIAGCRCRGIFGVIRQSPDGGDERMVCGETVWQGRIEHQADDRIIVESPRPAGWPEQDGLSSATAWVCTAGDSGVTGFPVQSTSDHHIAITRFPMPACHRFTLPSLRFTKTVLSPEPNYQFGFLPLVDALYRKPRPDQQAATRSIVSHYYRARNRYAWPGPGYHPVYTALSGSISFRHLLPAYVALAVQHALTPDVTEAFLKLFLGIARALHRRETTLAMNNQTVTNCQATALFAAAFPEFREADAMRRRAVQRMMQHFEKGFLADGSYYERSFDYSRVTLHDALSLYHAAQRAGPVASVVTRAARRVTRRALGYFEKALAPPCVGPAIGDSRLEAITCPALTACITMNATPRCGAATRCNGLAMPRTILSVRATGFIDASRPAWRRSPIG